MSSAPMEPASVKLVKLAANLLQETLAVALSPVLSAVAMESTVARKATAVIRPMESVH